MRGAGQLNQQFSGHTEPLGDLLAAMVALGHDATTAGQALQHFGELVGSPRQELLFRLNARLQGEDPGQPTHWRGL